MLYIQSSQLSDLATGESSRVVDRGALSIRGVGEGVYTGRHDNGPQWAMCLESATFCTRERPVL